MEPKDLHKRLEKLNREPLPRRDAREADLEGLRRRVGKMREEAPARPGEPIQYRRELPRIDAKPAERRIAGPPVSLEEAARGRQAAVQGAGTAYVITTQVAGEGEQWAGLCSAFVDAVRQRGPEIAHRAGLGGEAGPARPEEMLFLDLETTGLAGTPLFLIGTMVWEGGLVVRQYFARDYSEERPVISLFLRDAADKRLLVSFNGKSFDVPYVRVRAAATGVPFELAAGHLDLLHESRRAWGRRLPDCKLQTLEQYICGRARHGDIPGAEIPDAYHAYVRTANAAEMLMVLEHNKLDLMTLADLLLRLPERA